MRSQAKRRFAAKASIAEDFPRTAVATACLIHSNVNRTPGATEGARVTLPAFPLGHLDDRVAVRVELGRALVAAADLPRCAMTVAAGEGQC
jgi:hypothetical protein